MIHIKVYNNNVEKALSKLKKQVKETKLLLELKNREFYTKPSLLKREKRAKARCIIQTMKWTGIKGQDEIENQPPKSLNSFKK